VVPFLLVLRVRSNSSVIISLTTKGSLVSLKSSPTGISKEMDLAVAKVSFLKGALFIIFKFLTLTSALGKLLMRLKLISSKLRSASRFLSA